MSGRNNTHASTSDPRLSMFAWRVDPLEERVLLSASVGDCVWLDANANGTKDAGEIGVAGAVVELFTPGVDGLAGTGDDASQGVAVTDENGAYSFAGVAAGNYFLQFRVPAGYAYTLAHQGADDAIDSDADPTSGLSPIFALDGIANNLTLDCGLTGATPDFGWAITTGSSGAAYGFAVAVDAFGNCYVTGYFSGTVNMGNGPCGILTSAGGSDVFVAKYDSFGNVVWIEPLGGAGDDCCYGIAVDSWGNLYIAGGFSGTGDFAPGPSTANLTSAGLGDIFVCKLDSNGEYVWATAMGGASSEVGCGMAIDSSGNVYTTGFFQGTADFDPSSSTAYLTSAGYTDVFVSKLSNNGEYLWAKAMGGTGEDRGRGIALDSSGSVYTTGCFYGTADFDPSASTADLVSTGNSDIFVSKLSSSGEYVWAKAMGGAGYDDGYGIAVDSSSNIYTTGEFQGIADFDPSASTANLPGGSSFTIFVSKLSSSGAYIWAKAMIGTDTAVGYSIALDPSGNVCTTGTFRGWVDFDPSSSMADLTSAGHGLGDIFVSKLSNSGDYVWAKAMGGIDEDCGHGIALGSSGNVYSTGNFTGTADFDPSASAAANLGGEASTSSCLAVLSSSGTYVDAEALVGASPVNSAAVATDGSGNVYATGSSGGSSDFDAGPGVYNVTGYGDLDIFVAKYTPQGALLWARAMGGAGEDYARGIAVDSSGNVYTVGHFSGTADFDPSAFTANLTSAGYYDIFVAKLDSSGVYVWARAMGGTSADFGYGIVLDSSGNVYTTGNFQGTADFDPSASTANLASAGGRDIFVSRLSSSGEYVWAKAMGGTNNDQGNGIALDSSDNVCTTGRFHGTADFDPSASTANLTSAGSDDIFVSKLDSSGAYVWAKAMGGTDSDSAYGIAVDSSGNVYTTGSFSGTADFDPSVSWFTLTARAWGKDIFVSKLESSGAYVWARAWGSASNDDCGYGIVVDLTGNVYIAGYFKGTAEFGSTSLTSAGNRDIFVSKLSSSGGVCVWAKAVGGIYTDEASGIALDSSGNLYATGRFQDTADFDPGAGTYNLTNKPWTMFLSRLTPTGISGTVWNDLDGDGVRDSGENGIADVTINLKRSGSTVATTTTNAAGAYGFPDLTSGSYSVDIDQSSAAILGYVLTAGSDPSSVVFASTERKKADFGYWSNLNALPPMAVSGGPYVIDLGQSLTLDGSASYDPNAGGLIVNYAWDLNNDGVFTDATGATPTVSWATLAALGWTTGTRTIALQVADIFGATGVSTCSVTIYPQGDLDYSGSVTPADIDLLVASYGGAARFDLTGEGAVDQDDLTYLLQTVLCTDYGDANLDQYVDFLDFQTLLDNWQLDSGWGEADFTGNGITDFADFQVMLDCWNPVGASGPAVAETPLTVAGVVSSASDPAGPGAAELQPPAVTETAEWVPVPSVALVSPLKVSTVTPASTTVSALPDSTLPPVLLTDPADESPADLDGMTDLLSELATPCLP